MTEDEVWRAYQLLKSDKTDTNSETGSSVSVPRHHWHMLTSSTSYNDGTMTMYALLRVKMGRLNEFGSWDTEEDNGEISFSVKEDDFDVFDRAVQVYTLILVLKYLAMVALFPERKDIISGDTWRIKRWI